MSLRPIRTDEHGNAIVSDLSTVATVGMIDPETGLPAWAAKTGILRQAGEAAMEILQLGRDFELRVDEIRADGDLTEAGKQSRITAIAQNVLTQLALPEERLKRLNSEIALEQDALRLPRPDGVIGELRAREIRDVIRAIPDEAVRISALTDAVVAGDGETLAAIMAAPSFERIVPAETIEKVTADYFAASQPDRIAYLENVEIARDQLAGTLEHVRHELITTGRLEAETDLTRTARGDSTAAA